jgi:putative ABC transport system permease protein
MSYLTLVWKSAFRNRLRTLLTSLGVAIAIIAFLFLRTFIAAWYTGVEASSADRLIVRNKISLTFPLPKAYLEKIRNLPGVKDVSYANWMGSYYKDPKQFFANFAVDPESYLRNYPEFVLSDEEKKAWFEDRSGAIIGEVLAEKYNWKVGDRVTLNGTIYAGTWDFTIRGIYHGREKTTDRQSFMCHWKYIDERSQYGKDHVGWYVVNVAGADGSKMARDIDTMFANSLAETRSESEKAFNLSFISMSSAVLAAIQIVSFVVLVILVLILGNTLAMATRERTTEYAAMRAIGFQPRHIVGLVLGEGFTVALVGVAIGVGLSAPILKFFANFFARQLGAFLGSFDVAPDLLVISSGVALGLGMLASAIPARRAGKMKIVDALRRIE